MSATRVRRCKEVAIVGGTVEPRLLRGLRDVFPEHMHARQWIIDTIRGVYERYGYVPLGTPAIEYLDILMAGPCFRNLDDGEGRRELKIKN